MTLLTFVTGNIEKFRIAAIAFQEAGIQLVQSELTIDEIQGEEPELIARDKADKAYAQMKGPVVINDDSWSIAGLNGFPGRI